MRRLHRKRQLRQKSLQPLSERSNHGDDDVPYEIDTYLVEQATGKIDADYMNSRFEKYITALYNQEEEAILAPLREAMVKRS